MQRRQLVQAWVNPFNRAPHCLREAVTYESSTDDLISVSSIVPTPVGSGTIAHVGSDTRAS